jgi:hypothetical protein
MKKLLSLLLLLPLLCVGQDKLPDWFLNPPVSPDNSCIYLIGISDPGLNRNEATNQAVARAKAQLITFNQIVDASAYTGVQGQFESVSRSVNKKSYLKENFETVNTHVSNYNEVLVLLKYSFMERKNATNADSILITSLTSFYSIIENDKIEFVLESVAKLKENKRVEELYYIINGKDNIDSVSSVYESYEMQLYPDLKNVKCVFKNQQKNPNSIVVQNFKETQKASCSLNKGLWTAFLMSQNQAAYKLSEKLAKEIKNQKSGIVGQMMVYKNISISDNRLEVTLAGTNYTEGFITVTYPEDLDTNIPISAQKKPNRFALIIGNEDYNSFQQGLSSEVNVDFALNDAATFHQYAIKTLGVPAENAVLLTNARAMDMHKAIDKLALLAKSLNGKAELIFYYAGHGFPDDNKEAFLIPVDVSGNDLRFAIKLKELYAKLTQYPAARVTVILDACFSGGARNQGLVAARAVKVRPKDDALTGNLVVLTASSGDQSSLPFKEKKHGMFTYHLLKKMQETKGEITYDELFNHLQEQVGVKSLLINSKEQTPQANVSPTLGDDWKGWKVK